MLRMAMRIKTSAATDADVLKLGVCDRWTRKARCEARSAARTNFENN